MTEAEWIAAESVEPLLKWLKKSKRRKPTVRKLQLLANALVDRLSDRLDNQVPLRARQFLDRLLEETVPYDECLTECRRWEEQLPPILGNVLGFAVLVSVPGGSYRFGPPDARACDVAGAVCQLIGTAERANQSRLLRDIFGNPFRPVVFSESWRTETALTLARQMYESRDFSAMPILADALQDAGCDSEDVLAHCRGPGPHVRGCWVVDLVLGKE